MPFSSDRRDTPRKDTAIVVHLLGDDSAHGPMVAQDISLGGMMVTSPVPRWPGEMLQLRFTLPGQERAIRTTCRIVDLVQVPRGVGLTLQFLRLAPLAQLAIHRYVDTRPVDNDPEKGSFAEVQGWVARILEDCNQLRALARG